MTRGGGHTGYSRVTHGYMMGTGGCARVVRSGMGRQIFVIFFLSKVYVWSKSREIGIMTTNYYTTYTHLVSIDCNCLH